MIAGCALGQAENNANINIRIVEQTEEIWQNIYETKRIKMNQNTPKRPRNNIWRYIKINLKDRVGTLDYD